jgi:hypothetical protein
MIFSATGVLGRSGDIRAEGLKLRDSRTCVMLLPRYKENIMIGSTPQINIHS